MFTFITSPTPIPRNNQTKPEQRYVLPSEINHTKIKSKQKQMIRGHNIRYSHSVERQLHVGCHKAMHKRAKQDKQRAT